MKKGKVLTVKELKLLNNGDYIHLEYYNDEGQQVCDGFEKLCVCANEHGTWYDADGYTIKINEYDCKSGDYVDFADDLLLEDVDNSGYSFTVCEAILNSKQTEN